jgi:hypothetical protein
MSIEDTRTATWGGDASVFADLKGLEPGLRAMLTAEDHTHFRGEHEYLLHQHPHSGPHEHPGGDLGRIATIRGAHHEQ